MIASTGVTATVITVAAGVIAGVGATKQSPIPLRVRVRRRLRTVRRR
jgi:hypothetical protein